jgi:hypothetical protein
VPRFSLDKHDDVPKAIEFLLEYGFVCIEPSATTLTDCKQISAAQQPAGHAAFAFLHSASARTTAEAAVFNNKFQHQVGQVLNDDVHDFEPDAVAHSQAAWNLRCNARVREFFAALYKSTGAVAGATLSIAEIADQLLPSIESLTRGSGLPTFHYNPAWARAPHVIASYHMDAYNEAVQAYFDEYTQQTSAHENDTATSNDDEQLSDARIKQRWLVRLRKELIATTGKVILGKRATNKMVQDAAFHAKDGNGKTTPQESTTTAATTTSTPLEAMRPLTCDAKFAGYEALFFTGTETAGNDLTVVPGFHRFYPLYLACKRGKWSTLAGDEINVLPDEDTFSAGLFETAACSLGPLPCGSIVVINRDVPRWRRAAAGAATASASVLPVSYRWQHDATDPALTVLTNQVTKSGHSLLLLARICPLELARSATYRKSVENGVVFKSLPHLTGATQFDRNTKKTAIELKQQRQAAYNAWVASLPNKSDAVATQHHYCPPTLPPYINRLLAADAALVESLEYQCDRLTHMLGVTGPITVKRIRKEADTRNKSDAKRAKITPAVTTTTTPKPQSAGQATATLTPTNSRTTKQRGGDEKKRTAVHTTPVSLPVAGQTRVSRQRQQRQKQREQQSRAQKHQRAKHAVRAAHTASKTPDEMAIAAVDDRAAMLHSAPPLMLHDNEWDSGVLSMAFPQTIFTHTDHAEELDDVEIVLAMFD